MEMIVRFIKQGQGLLSHTTFSDVAVALLSLFLFSALVQRTRHKGPMMWPLLGITPSFIIHLGHIYDWITDEANRWGGTFSWRAIALGRLFGVITIDPINLEYVLKTRFKNFPKGAYYRERFAELLGDGIFNADDELWKEQRRAAATEIHTARFVDFSVKTTEELVHRKLMKVVEKLSESGRSVDLQDLLLRFTFDNICAAAFGVDPGCLALDLPEVAFARAFEMATADTLFRFMVPPIVWKTMRLLQIGSERRLREAVKIVHGFAENCVLVRRTECRKLGGLSDRFDLLSRLVEAHDSDSLKFKFSDKFLKDLCISFILAGRDTSSVALAWFFWLLNKHPEVESRIVGEIKEILQQRGKKEEEEEYPLSVEELKRMNYLQAALSESLRLYPSVPIDFKEVMEDDVLPDGTPVKKRAKVIYSLYSMGRSAAIWGEDCREFRPERWIKEGEFVSENQFKYAVFNAGPRLCVGKKFAYMQMKMVAANVLKSYCVRVVAGQVVAPKITTTLYMKNGLQVTFRPRK